MRLLDDRIAVVVAGNSGAVVVDAITGEVAGLLGVGQRITALLALPPPPPAAAWRWGRRAPD
ncbi:hypothetical protein [Streptomyces sp. NPDC096032]|uniref:hypothetical protein n=1 Tax=Streptomyces sp. NPDC096032 TaxID=3366070 RepID=UPI003830C24C